MKKKWETVSKLPDGIRYKVKGRKILVTEKETFEVKTDEPWPEEASMVISFGPHKP